MGNCSRCQRTTTLLVECSACHESFCEVHREPTDHDCREDSTGDGPATSDADPVGPADGDPTVLYPDEVRTGARDEDESTDDDGPVPAPMDFDPTAGITRLLRTAGVVVVVLVVGLASAGVLWMGPGPTALDDAVADGLPGGVDTTTGTSADGAVADGLNTTRAERLIHEYTNRERREAGASTVEYDAELAEISEYHSRDMGQRSYVAHTNPDGETIADRYREFGYACDTNGEVIQWVDYAEVSGTGSDEEALARTVVENWMSSELHRSFVLNGSWSREGVGVYLTDSGRVYVTQNTCRED